MAQQLISGLGIVILVWEKAKCKEGISHYRIYLDNEVIGNTNGDIGTYTINNLPLGVELSFKVVAITNMCRTSTDSNTAKITIGSSTPNVLNYNLQFYI